MTTMMTRCAGCDEDPHSLLSVENVLHCQKVSDFLIALAYFSIPLEIFYFVTCAAIFPFRWVLLQFGAFIVLCGLTHLLTALAFAPHSFLLMLSLTIAKFLTALVSVATAVTLVTLIPQLLRVFVREGMLRRKTRELDREVGIMKRQEEASWHVRMLTREIRRSLDRHTILYTTLVELSKVLFLEHSAIWIPSEQQHQLVLTHETRRRDLTHLHFGTQGGPRRARSIPIDDPEVAEIVCRGGAVVLCQDSTFVSVGDEDEVREDGIGPVAAIRLPLLKTANFKSGTPELCDASYAVLVLMLASDGDDEREWTDQELDIVEAVADQVAVALSHAAVLNDSLVARKQLMDRNLVLNEARKDAEMANKARDLFQKVMGQEMVAPIRSVEAFLSALQLGNLRPEQMVMVKGGLALSSLVEDATVLSRLEDGDLELKLRSFNLHPMVEDVVKVAKLLSAIWGVRLEWHVSDEIPKRVIGDERRILQAVIYMVGNVLECGDHGMVVLRVSVESASSQGLWKQSKIDNFIKVGFEVGRADSILNNSSRGLLQPIAAECDRTPGLSICRKLAQLMQGDLSVTNASQGGSLSLNLEVRLLQEQQAAEGAPQPRYLNKETASNLLKGMKIVLGDSNGFSRTITRTILERTGCDLTVVSSWYQCLEVLYAKGTQLHVLLIDVRFLEEGNEFSARIRKLKSQSSWLLIVALVPNSSRETREACLLTGIHGAVSTPVILDELVEELHRITQLRATPALR